MVERGVIASGFVGLGVVKREWIPVRAKVVCGTTNPSLDESSRNRKNKPKVEMLIDRSMMLDRLSNGGRGCC